LGLSGNKITTAEHLLLPRIPSPGSKENLLFGRVNQGFLLIFEAEMNTDFRVSVDFFTHHKARKLEKRLGASGIVGLLRLWAYAAKVRISGDLSGMDEESIEIAAEWGGEDGAFCAALLEVGFLDRGESGLLLHDWPMYQWHLGKRDYDYLIGIRRPSTEQIFMILSRALGDRVCGHAI
jgi:hypothetical protein